VTDAVLLTCHGTIHDVRDMPAFLAKIRHGRPAPDELVREIVRRYEAIGGSPLMEHTYAQARGLEARLGIPVRAAGRLWDPSIATVLGELASLGATRVLSLPLAPQSVHVYHASVRQAASAHASIEVVYAPSWGGEPALIAAYLETIDEGLARARQAWNVEVDPAKTPILLTAHSLPKRVIDGGDPYAREFESMAARVGERVRERGHEVLVAYQSQGASSEPWLGPDLPETFRSLRSRGFTQTLVAPIWFVAEHVETLYDLDLEAPGLARAAGLEHFARAPALCARTKLIDALESVSRSVLELPR
jgi:ferrochelatase